MHLPLVFAKVFCSPLDFGRKKLGAGTAYYINSDFFGRFVRGKIFLSKEMSGVKFSYSANLLKIADVTAKIWVNDVFTREMLCVFCGYFL
jgi:hypothetical protein